jgi:hypothetical protein
MRKLAIAFTFIFATCAANLSAQPIAAPGKLPVLTFAQLGNPPNGQQAYCSNCNAAAPCTSGGTGAVAVRVAGAWNCSIGSPSGGGSGTVTSVAATVPSFMAVGGSPITTSGTLAFSFGSQAANLFLASPNGSSGTPTFRALVAADVPTLNQNTTGTASLANALATARAINGVNFDGTAAITVTAAGSTLSDTVTVAKGGTGATTLTANNVILGNGTAAVQLVAPGTSGNVLTSNGTTWASSAASGAPGGSTTQLQYNNAGAFGGVSGITSDGTNATVGSSAHVYLPATLNCSAPSLAFTGDTGTGVSYRTSGAFSFCSGGEAVRIEGGTLKTFNAGPSAQLSPSFGLTWQILPDLETVTLSTSGTTTLSSGNRAHANTRILRITYAVTTTIATATAFTISVNGGSPWCNIGTATTSQTGLTSGTSGELVPCTANDAYVGNAAQKLLVTTTGTPSAGAIHLYVVYEQVGVPAS